MKKTAIIIILILVIAAGFYFFNDSQSSDQETDRSDVIRVQSPKEGESISSPVNISGEAIGTWFFEASFSVVLVDWDGRIIGEAIVTAQDEWMTESFVPFTATLNFDADPDSYSDRGTLIFHKHNASGLPEHDDSFEVDVVIESNK